MGRDEHNTSKGLNRLDQTPKNQITDDKYVEFSDELANQDNKEARARAEAPERRVERKL